ncbi:retrovirus-related pol polyprotein from transposon TNT 1-94 [Tanacetum coccineum]
MDLCGPMRVASVNGKKYILVIVDDYSRFTWVKHLRSKDEAPDFIIKFLKMIQVWLKVHVRRIRTDNGTEFQNGVAERRNRTLIEAAHTMLIYAKALLFLWAEAVATACYTKNRSIVRIRHGKTRYDLLHDKPPDLSFFHVFGALCYPTNDSENLDFDELTVMASEHSSSGPALHEMTPATISLGLVPNPSPSTPFVSPSRSNWDILFQPLFDKIFTPPPSVDHPAPEVIALIANVVAPEPAASTGSPSSTIVDQDAPSPSNSQTTPKNQSPIIPNDVEEDNHDLDVAHMNNDPYFGIPILEVPSDQSSSTDSIHTIVHPDHQISEHNSKWTKDHPLKNIIDELDRPLDELRGMLKNKARLLACGYTQEERIDLEESFDPGKMRIMLVVKIHAIAHLVVCSSWEIDLLAGHQKGIKALHYPVRKLNILLCPDVVLKSIHIDIRFHFIKEHVENGVIELYFVNMEYQLVDIFTKALGRERIEYLINKLGMRKFTPETLKQLADEVDE